MIKTIKDDAIIEKHRKNSLWKGSGEKAFQTIDSVNSICFLSILSIHIDVANESFGPPIYCLKNVSRGPVNDSQNSPNSHIVLTYAHIYYSMLHYFRSIRNQLFGNKASKW